MWTLIGGWNHSVLAPHEYVNPHFVVFIRKRNIDIILYETSCQLYPRNHSSRSRIGSQITFIFLYLKPLLKSVERPVNNSSISLLSHSHTFKFMFRHMLQSINTHDCLSFSIKISQIAWRCFRSFPHNWQGGQFFSKGLFAPNNGCFYHS